MTHRLVVVSDLHIGPDADAGKPSYNIFAGAEELPKLAAILGEGDHLVLNGDAFDFLLDGEPLELARAKARAEAILSGSEGEVVVAALRGILARNGRVTLRIGNHDPELGLPEIQALVRMAIPGIALETGEAQVIEIGGARVLVAHGEEDDVWNRFEHAAIVRGPDGGFRYPPGSRLVKDLMNRAKSEHGLRFADLLKPDVEGAVLAILAVEPKAVRLLAGSHTARLVRQLWRRQSDPYAAVAPGELPHPGIAELDGMAADALLELIEARDAEGLLGRALAKDVRAAWLRAGLRLWARVQRHAAGDKGDAYFELEPEVAEWNQAQALAAAHDVSVVLLGHTHAARIGQYGGLTFANSGTWIPLMRLPPAGAPIDEWTALLEDLREDGRLEHRAKARLIHRFTAVEVTPATGGLRVALAQYREGDRIELGARVAAPEAGPRRAFTVRRGAPIEEDDAQLAHRIEAFEEELEQWARRNPAVTWEVLTSKAHLDVLYQQATEELARAKQAKGYEALEALASAEAIWELYRTADAQRRHPQLGLRLQHADAIAFYGYRVVMEAALNRGLHAASGARQPVPLVYLEPTLSPATYRRGARIPAPALSTRLHVDLRFPVILLPHDHLASPWWLTVIQHEVGHDLDHDLGLRSDLSKALKQELGGDHPRLDAWRHWLPEILADVVAVHLAGPGFIASLRQIAAPLVEWQWDVGDVHPPLALRLDLLHHIVGGAWERPEGYAEPEAIARQYRDDLADVVRAVLDAPLQGTTTTLKDLLPTPEDSVARWWSLPGAFQANLAQATDAAELARKFDEAAAKLEQQSWQVPEAYRDFITKQVPRLAPTILEPNSLHKIPPLDLLRQFDEAWFVGATNGQLLHRIEQAFRERGRKWTRMVFLFLDDAGLATIAEDEARAQELIAERNRAEADLKAAMQEHRYAERFAFDHYAQPFVFASFWRKPGVRRVHVSAKVWGVDIRDCPAVDYRAVEGQLNPELDRYFAGLGTLCRTLGLGDHAP